MARKTSIDRLPDEVKELIGELRRHGRTIDEILGALHTLDPERLGGEDVPSRSALARHTQRLDVIGERIRASREAANALAARIGDAGEGKQLRLNVELMHASLMQLLGGFDGDDVTLTSREAAQLSAALADLARAAKTDADHVLRLRREAQAEAAASVEKAAAAQGLSADTVAAIKARVLGAAA